MYKDPTEFRARFKAYKEGKMPYENGLPKFAGGTPGQTPDESFVESMGPLLYRELLYQGVENPDSVYNNLIHQLAYESNRGRSRVAREQHNYGGVGWNGKTYFSYKNDADFVHDYVKLMNHRYKKAIAAPTLSEYAAGIKKLGYFEDSLENYSRNLNGMKSLAKAATKHKQSNPDLYKIDVLRSAPETIVNPMDNTKVITTIPAEQTIPAYDTKVSPYISGKPTIHLQPRIKLPNLLDMLDDEWEPTIGFKNGKLPCFAIGKGDGMKYSWDDQKQEWNRYTGDEYGDVFADFVVTPRGGAHKKDIKPVKIVTPEQEAFVAQNQPIIKLDDDLFLRNRISEESNKRTWRSDVADALHAVGEGAMLASMFAGPEVEPLVYPAYNAAKAAIANAIKTYTEKTAPTMLSMMVRPLMRLNVPLDSWIHFPQKQLYIRYPYSVSWDDFIKDPKVGKYFDEGGEAIIYESKNNPGYLTKLKSELGEGCTLEDLEFMVNRDLHVNDLPGVEPILYKGFSVSNNPIKILDPVTKKPKTILNERFYPIYELKKLTPYHKVNTEAFDIDQEMLVNDWANLHGYKHLPNGWLKYGNISISDLGFNNFAFDDFGNMKFIDPMIQNFANGKSPIHIKPANRGKLTRLKARTGKSESELYNDGNPAHKKMVVFARNARKWKH